MNSMQDSFDFFKNKFKFDMGSRVIQAIIALVLILGVFTLGFYSGASNTERSLALSPKNDITSNVNLDEFWDVWKILDERFAPASSTAKVWLAGDRTIA